MSAAKSSAACSDGARCHASARIRSRFPRACTVDLEGQHLTAKGKLGELQLAVHDDVDGRQVDGDKLIVTPRTDEPPRAHDVGHRAQPGRATW